MTQLDLFASCTSPHGQVSTPARTPPPRRLVATDPELWDALGGAPGAALALLTCRHPGDPEAQARALHAVQGPSSYRGRVLEGMAETGARYGRAHVLAWRIRNGKEAVA